MRLYANEDWMSVRVSDALYHLDPQSGASPDYARGVLIGVVATLQAVGMSFEAAFEYCLHRFPENFREYCIPGSWLGLDTPTLPTFKQVPSFCKLWNALPEDQRSDEVKFNMISKYLYLNKMLWQYAKDSPDAIIEMGEFRQAGSQFIAEFAVRDTSKQRTESYNWHGQNTSQWLFAGCLLVQDGRVSIHT